jgi:hypothetical protein
VPAGAAPGLPSRAAADSGESSDISRQPSNKVPKTPKSRVEFESNQVSLSADITCHLPPGLKSR